MKTLIVPLQKLLNDDGQFKFRITTHTITYSTDTGLGLKFEHFIHLRSGPLCCEYIENGCLYITANPRAIARARKELTL